MTRSYVWHNDPERPDESYCSQEKVWKPKSEFNWSINNRESFNKYAAIVNSSRGVIVMQGTEKEPKL